MTPATPMITVDLRPRGVISNLKSSPPPSPDICPSNHTCNIAHTGVNHAGNCFIRSGPHGGIMGYLNRIGLPPRTMQATGVTRRPWCLSCCQQLDRSRCAMAPFAC